MREAGDAPGTRERELPRAQGDVSQCIRGAEVGHQETGVGEGAGAVVRASKQKDYVLLDKMQMKIDHLEKRIRVNKRRQAFVAVGDEEG